jgi:N-acetylglucosamine kinase-like BadF-type ATPase
MSILAIDSGATCSELIIVNNDGDIIYSGNFEPVNFTISGYLRAAETLSNIISKAAKEAKTKISCISAGIAGARSQKDRDLIRRELSRIHGIKNVFIYPDTEIALAAYFNEGQSNAGILISGTGSILFYRDRDGKLNRIGGWGRLFDDEGSGYWIGREALNRLVKYYDTRLVGTSLAALFRRKYGFTPQNLVQKIYRENFDIASLARDVCYCAEKGDRTCRHILIEAAYRLSRHFETLKRQRMTIGLCGSVFNGSAYLKKEFFKIMNKEYPKMHVLYEMRKPVMGALKLALAKMK